MKYEEDAAAEENEVRWLDIASAANAAGLGFLVVTERHLEPIEAAVLEVYRDRHAPRPTEVQLDIVVRRVAQPTTAAEIERLVGISSQQVRALIRRQVLRYTHSIAPYSAELLLQAAEPAAPRMAH